MTGQLEEEKMQVYVRLGIRLLYKASNKLFPSCLPAAPCHHIKTLGGQGARSRLEGARGMFMVLPCETSIPS